MGPGLLALLVSPDCNEPGSINIVDQATRIKRVLKRRRSIKVALSPPLQVYWVCQQITLVVVATRMRKNKIMAKINRVSRPGYEMIRMAFTTNLFAAIKSPGRLVITHNHPVAIQVSAF